MLLLEIVIKMGFFLMIRGVSMVKAMRIVLLCVSVLWIVPKECACRGDFLRNSSSSSSSSPPLSQRPSSVNVGALFTYDSFIGRAAKPAFKAAMDDVNADQTVLKGIKLNIVFQDSNCSGFIGTMGGIHCFFSLKPVAKGKKQLFSSQLV